MLVSFDTVITLVEENDGEYVYEIIKDDWVKIYEKSNPKNIIYYNSIKCFAKTVLDLLVK